MATKGKGTPAQQSGAGAAQTGAVVAQAGGALALPQDLQDELAQYAKDDAAKERPKVAKISLKSGVMTYNGNDMDDNEIEAVIVGGAYRNVFYGSAYDPDNIVNPSCFALSDKGDGMVPHENVKDPVAKDCTSCANMQWGSGRRSDGKPSRGKACKQTRRVMLLPSDALSSVEDVKTAEMAIMDVPVTSVGNYGNFINVLAATVNRPVWAVATVIKVVPSKKNQFEVKFTPVRAIDDADVLRALMKRRDEALRIALTPYEGTGGENDPEAGKPQPETKVGKKF